jgi:hypothetical protein
MTNASLVAVTGWTTARLHSDEQHAANKHPNFLGPTTDNNNHRGEQRRASSDAQYHEHQRREWSGRQPDLLFLELSQQLNHSV